MKRGLTPLGKALRKYRIDRSETQLDVADALEVSIAYFSAIENGKKNASPDFIYRVGTHFDLNENQLSELEELAWISRKEVKLNMQEQSDAGREFFAAFARKFQDTPMTDEQLKQFRKLLNMGD